MPKFSKLLVVIEAVQFDGTLQSVDGLMLKEKLHEFKTKGRNHE